MRTTTPLLLLFLLTKLAFCDDWPKWRGPQLNGVSNEKGWLDQWPKDGPPIAWKANVGTGFSSVAVSDGRLFTLGHKDNQDTVHCINSASGKKVWSHSYKSDVGANLFEGGPTATPCVDGKNVYVLSRWGEAFCFDAATGKVQWSKNVAKDQEMPVPGWGFSGSPIVVGELLLLNVGESGMAMNKATGKVVWTSAKEEPGYSTPIPFERDGKTLAIFSSGRAYYAVEVKTGKVAWEHRWLTRYGVNASDPIVAGDQVFISTGYSKGATLLKIVNGQPKSLWQNKSMRNQMSPSVLIGGHVYGIDGDEGRPGTTLRCIELKTGKVTWTEPGVGYGTLTAADGKLIVLSEQGELMIAPASPTGFTPTAKAKVLNGKCWTTPVLANGRIYCRNASGDLVSVDVRGRR